MKGDIKAKVTGLYHVTLTDSITGEIKYKNTFHNILINHGLLSLTNNMPYSGQPRQANGLAVGTGTSTPAFSNTGLASLLWTTQAITVTREFLNDGYTQKSTKSFRFPATSSYVNSAISEASLYCSTFREYNTGGGVETFAWLTRCLFTDSEGQPITINKTSLDILDIVVELEITMISSDPTEFKIYPYNNRLKILTAGLTNIAQITYGGYISLFKFDEDINGIYPQDDANVNYGSYCLGNGIFGVSVDTTNKKVTIAQSTIRVLNTVLTSEVYYKGLGMGKYGMFMLNSNNFTPYTITDIAIGTGDGTETQFYNPLSYFKQGTETIYIDGVEVDSADYTINNISNINKKLEICDMIKPSTALSDIKSNDSIFGNCTLEFASMFKPTTVARKKISQFDTTQECFGINSENPAILDFGTAKTFNFVKGFNIRLLRKRIDNGTYDVTTTGATIYIDSSDDGIDWTNVDSVVVSNTQISKDFASSVTARYWRFRTSQTDEDATYYYAVIVRSNDYVNDCGIALGNYDPFITFTTAPADGAAVTMDVDMDIIMKNGNFAIDLAPTISLQVTS